MSYVRRAYQRDLRDPGRGILGFGAAVRIVFWTPSQDLAEWSGGVLLCKILIHWHISCQPLWSCLGQRCFRWVLWAFGFVVLCCFRVFCFQTWQDFGLRKGTDAIAPRHRKCISIKHCQPNCWPASNSPSTIPIDNNIHTTAPQHPQQFQSPWGTHGWLALQSLIINIISITSIIG